MLIIIDYIFDWARDIYRPTIISQLKSLAEATVDKGREQGGAHIAMTDSDILSLSGNPRMMDVMDWRDSVTNIEQVGYNDCNIEAWGALDSEFGVFRPAWIIESVFQCLYVTKENFEDLFNSVPANYTAKKLAGAAGSSLRDNHVLISEDVLRKMEEIWTNRARPQDSHSHSENQELYATIVYHTEISKNLELQAFISCIAFDEEALVALQSYTARKTRHRALANARGLSRINAERLLGGLQQLSIESHLAAAIVQRRQHLKTVAGTRSTDFFPTFEFVDESASGYVRIEPLISKVYNWRKAGSREPTESYLRVSRDIRSLSSIPGASTVSSHFPTSEPSKDENFNLVVHTWRETNWHTKHLCLYQIIPTKKPPSRQELAEALWRNDSIYFTGNYTSAYNSDGRRKKLSSLDQGYVTTTLDIQKWRHHMKPWLPTTYSLDMTLEVDKEKQSATRQKDSGQGIASNTAAKSQTSSATKTPSDATNQPLTRRFSSTASGSITAKDGDGAHRDGEDKTQKQRAKKARTGYHLAEGDVIIID